MTEAAGIVQKLRTNTKLHDLHLHNMFFDLTTDMTLSAELFTRKIMLKTIVIFYTQAQVDPGTVVVRRRRRR